MDRKFILAAFAAAVMGMGSMWAGADAKAETTQKEAKAGCGEGAGAGQCALPQAPKEQKFRMPGITLVNPENGEAVLLVQIMHPQAGPQMVGVPIKQDENGKKLVQEFGIKSVKPGDMEAAKKAEAQAKEKFVMVSGIIRLTGQKPELTVDKYESAKDLLAKAQAAAVNETPVKEKAAVN